MTIRTAIVEQIRHIADEHELEVSPLSDDLVLVESGLDSLAIAILVTRLEETLDLDPFTAADNFPSIVTFGDFVRLYEEAAA
jgi:acyl carrier protein